MAFHIFPSLVRVVSVSIQMNNPRASEKSAHTTIMYPCSLNHPRDVGISMAGIESRNVKKTAPAFPNTTVGFISYRHET